MGNEADGAGKAGDPWIYYTAQAQNLGKKALNSTDEALRTARTQIGHLQDSSSHHLAAAQHHLQKRLFYCCAFGVHQKFTNTLGQQYTHYEDMFFKQLLEGVHTIQRNPNISYGVLGVTTILALRTPRRLLFRYTIGRFQSEEAMVARAETRVKEMRQSVDLLKNESKKLEERARLAEEELRRGKTKLKDTGGQLSSLSSSVYKTESSARGLMDNLRELPGREALRLRAEVAGMTAETKQQRGLLDKRISRIASYGIPV